MDRSTANILIWGGLGGICLIGYYLYCRGEMFESASRFMLPYFVTGWEAQTGQKLPCDIHKYADRLQQSPAHREQAGQIKALMAQPCCGGCGH